MRGTFATALLLAASSRIAAESHQIDPRQLSPHVAKAPDKVNTKSSPRRFFRDNREQRVDLALTAADESRTIEKAVTSAVHGITDPSWATAATRDAVREMLDLNAFSRELGRPQFDLNFPPSETFAHLSETPDTSLRNHASTSTASKVTEATGRTNKQHPAPTQASIDMGYKAMSRKPLSKGKFKGAVPLKSTKRKRRAYKISAVAVDRVYTLYREHLTAKSLEFKPTNRETIAMLNLYVDSTTDPLAIATVLSNHFRKFQDEDLTVLKEKLGTVLTPVLSTLAALQLPPGMLKEIERPFVWYASLERWRDMYCDFFEFVKVNSEKITNSLPKGELYTGEASDILRDQLLATLKEEMDASAEARRIEKLRKDVKVVLGKYNVEEEIRAAIRELGEQFLETANSRNFSPKIQLKKPAAVKSTKRKRNARKTSTFAVYRLYTLYREHLMAKSLGFKPTLKETKAMLNLYVESRVDPSTISTVLSNFFRSFKNKDLTVFKEKLGTSLTSTLSTLAALELPPGMLREIERPFVWYASLVRWRAMYCDFFEFFKVNSDKITNLLFKGELYTGDTSDIVRNQLLAALKEDMDTNAETRRNEKLRTDVYVVLAKYNVKEEIGAAIRELVEQFLKTDHQIIPSQRSLGSPATSHSQLGNQRTDLTPYDLQIPGPEKNSFRHIESNDHDRGKRPRIS